MAAKPVYVVGHVNPDTDSIASAMGYAWLLKERDGTSTIAGRAGPINMQTSWVLKQLKMDPPTLITDASPRFESVMRKFDTVLPNEPLSEAWEIASRTGGVAPVVNEDMTPYGLINGRSLFTFIDGLLGPNLEKDSLSISQMMTYSCKNACDETVAKFHASSRIRDMLNHMLRVDGDEFWVVDENNKYMGICKQRDLLNPPRIQLIMVDHNESSQAIASLEEAEIIEILDHHRLGNPSTRIPIRFTVDVVGSTSTLVTERIANAGLRAPTPLAGLMLAGLLSDTLILKSPTTTSRDRKAAERLARWAFGVDGSLNGETIQSYGEKVLTAGSGITLRSADETLNADMKIYSGGGFDFAISQAEVMDLNELNEHFDELTSALLKLKENKNLHFVILMVTDVVRGSSRILTIDAPPVLEDLPYILQGDKTYLAEGVVSRKKQLLPTVLAMLEA